MNRELFLSLLEAALLEISEPRLYKTERGYQGELYAGLRARLTEAGFEGDPIIEQEYQKRAKVHGINIRPDLIIHIPFDRGGAELRAEGNFVAIELKRDPKDVASAFENLRQMKEHLGYPLTVLVMVDSAETFAHLCPQELAAQTVCAAARLEQGTPIIAMEACG